jgi:hypothetical protein
MTKTKGCLGCTGLLAIAFIGLVIVAVNAPHPPRNARTQSTLELLGDAGTTDRYSTTITGRVRNNSPKTYRYAQITFKLYNKAGEQVGSALANVNGLEGNGTWAFKAVGLHPSDKYVLNEISGF